MKKNQIRLLLIAMLLLGFAARAEWATNIVRIDTAMVIRGNCSLDEIEKTYAGMSPVNYTPPQGRWKQLPRTAKLLQSGPVLRIVMLGDSIITDTSHSAWDLLTQRRYPACAMDKVTCVRGSTGCWWYKDNTMIAAASGNRHRV